MTDSRMAERFRGIRGVLFDYGGTLDSGGDHWSEVIWRGWQEAGVPQKWGITKEVFRDAYVHAERELAKVRHILPDDDFHMLLLKKMRIELGWLSEHAGFPASEIEEKAQKIADYCDAQARSRIEEARPVLAALAAHYPLVLVSNFYGNVEAVLRAYDVRKYFRDIVESAVVGVRKPDPRIWTLGVRAVGHHPGEVLVVGDSYTKDIVPAMEAGCRAVWLKGKGWTEKEDLQEYSDIIGSISELIGDPLAEGRP